MTPLFIKLNIPLRIRRAKWGAIHMHPVCPPTAALHSHNWPYGRPSTGTIMTVPDAASAPIDSSSASRCETLCRPCSSAIVPASRSMCDQRTEGAPNRSAFYQRDLPDTDDTDARFSGRCFHNASQTRSWSSWDRSGNSGKSSEWSLAHSECVNDSLPRADRYGGSR